MNNLVFNLRTQKFVLLNEDLIMLIHHNANNPIVELFLIRNDQHYKFPDIEFLKQDPLFFDLPENKLSEISTLSDALNSQKSLKEALALMPFKADYNTEIIDILRTRSRKGTLSNNDTFFFLYECLSWISMDSQNQTADSLVALFDIFKSTVLTIFNNHANVIFQILVGISNQIQKESVFQILVDPILADIQINFSLDGRFYSTFIDFISKVQNMTDKTYFIKLTSVVSSLMADERQIFAISSIKELAYLFSIHIQDLNLKALNILCKCSRNPRDDATVSDLFLSIPHILYTKMHQFPVINKISDFVNEKKIEILNHSGNEPVKIDPDSFIMPGPDFVDSKVSILSLCHPWFQDFLNQFLPMLKKCGSCSLTSVLTSLTTMKKIIFASEYCIDFIVLMINILKKIGRIVPLHQSISLILNKFTFSEDMTIFTQKGLTDAHKVIRNEIFIILVKYDKSTFYDFFVQSAAHPLLYAELLMRSTYVYPLSNSFYSSEQILPSLVGASLLILQSIYSPIIDKADLARSIVLNILFGLFDAPETSLRCFKNHIFTAGFLSLIFEPAFSRLIVHSLTDCLSHFPVLPEPVSLFVTSLFNMCSLHHDDQQLSSIATNLAQAIIKSISHNITLGASFEPIFDSALAFIQKAPSNDMLDCVMTMSLLIAQKNHNLLASSNRFNNILNLIESVEGTEPSDQTLLRLQNFLNLSTNLAMNMMFLIKIPDALPILLISFSKSKRLANIFDLLINLCKFSIENIYQCHDGDVDLILLKSLKGSFEYRNRTVEFNYESNIVETHVMKLLSTIVSVRSSFIIDDLFLSVIQPDQSGQFNQYAELTISTLNSIFLSMTTLPSPVFPIVSTVPYILYDELKPVNWDQGFIFSFQCFIDVARCMTLPYTYYFLNITDDRKCNFSIFYQQKGLYARYEGNGFRTSAPLTRGLPSNEWINCIVIYEKDYGDFIVSLKFGKEDGDEVDFKRVDLQPSQENGNLHCSFCYSDGIIPIDQAPPVVMGPFCLISGDPGKAVLDSLKLRGVSGLPPLESGSRIVFSNLTANMKINNFISRPNFTIRDTMINHLTIDKLLPIFGSLRNAPKLYAESTLSIMKYIIDYSKIVYSDTTPSKDETEYLTELTGIKFRTPLEKFQREFHKLSSMSVLAYLILTNSRDLLNYNLFSALSSQAVELSSTPELSKSLIYFDNGDEKCTSLNLSTNKIAAQEFIENILFCPFYWCCTTPTQMKRICKQWANLIQRGFKQINETLFTNFLVQTHLLVHFSSRNDNRETLSVLVNNRFLVLEQFALSSTTEQIVLLVIDLIYSIALKYRQDPKLTYFINNNETLIHSLEESSVESNVLDDNWLSEMLHYIDFLGMMSEAQPMAFLDDAIMALLPLVDIDDVSVYAALLNLYTKANSMKTIQRVSHLSIRFFSRIQQTSQQLDTSTFPLEVQCIRDVICCDTDDQVIATLEKTNLPILNYMWYFWPIVVGFIRPKTMAASIEFLTRYPKEFEKIITIIDTFKVFRIFKTREFREHYIDTLAKRLMSNYMQVDEDTNDDFKVTELKLIDSDIKHTSDDTNILQKPIKYKDNENSVISALITPFFISHFYKYSCKPFSFLLLTEMSKMPEMLDSSAVESVIEDNKSKKNTNSNLIDLNKMIELLSNSNEANSQLPMNMKLMHRPYHSLVLFELCKEFIHRLKPPFSKSHEVILNYFNSNKNSANYPNVVLDTFNYFEDLLNEKSVQNIRKWSSNIKVVLIPNIDKPQLLKKYEKSISIQRKHFSEFITYGRSKSKILLSNKCGNFSNSSTLLPIPFIEYATNDVSSISKASKERKVVYTSSFSDLSLTENQWPELITYVPTQYTFICSFHAHLIQLNQKTSIMLKIFSDHLSIECEDLMPFNISYDEVSFVLIDDYQTNDEQSGEGVNRVRQFLKTKIFSRKSKLSKKKYSQSSSFPHVGYNTIEIFTISLQSYLIELSPDDKKKFMDLNKKVNIPFLANIEDFITNSLVPMWETWNISTFNFLLSLAILTGRSFNREDNYPVFPSPKLLSMDSKTIDIEPFNNDDYSDSYQKFINDHTPFEGNDIMPEFYYKYGSTEFVFNNRTPYENRRELEKIEFRRIIAKWINDRYSCQVNGVACYNSAPNKTFTSSTIITIRQGTDEKLPINSPFINIESNLIKFDRLCAIFGKNSNQFVYLDSKGYVTIAILNWNTFKFSRSTKIDLVCFTDNVFWVSNIKSIIFYDLSINKILKININSNDDGKKPPVAIAYSCTQLITSSSFIRIVNDFVVSVIDQTMLTICPISTFPKSGFRVIYHDTDDIVRIETNNNNGKSYTNSQLFTFNDETIVKSNGLIVILTQSGLLKAIPMANSACINEFDLFNYQKNTEKAIGTEDINDLKILVTDSLSLILVSIKLELYVFSDELKLLKTHTLNKPILSWVSYAMYNDIDYVAFVDTAYNLFSFEAYYPEKVESIASLNLLGLFAKQTNSDNEMNRIPHSISMCSSFGNLDILSSNDNASLYMKYIRPENMVAVFSTSGLMYTYYHPNVQFAPMTIGL